jgi:hypothetical protein
MPPKRKPDPPKKTPRQPLPEERARDAIAHEESIPGDKVRMTFRVVLACTPKPSPLGRSARKGHRHAGDGDSRGRRGGEPRAA